MIVLPQVAGLEKQLFPYLGFLTHSRLNVKTKTTYIARAVLIHCLLLSKKVENEGAKHSRWHDLGPPSSISMLTEVTCLITQNKDVHTEPGP